MCPESNLSRALRAPLLSHEREARMPELSETDWRHERTWDAIGLIPNRCTGLRLCCTTSFFSTCHFTKISFCARRVSRASHRVLRICPVEASEAEEEWKLPGER